MCIELTTVKHDNTGQHVVFQPFFFFLHGALSPNPRAISQTRTIRYFPPKANTTYIYTPHTHHTTHTTHTYTYTHHTPDTHIHTHTTPHHTPTHTYTHTCTHMHTHAHTHTRTHTHIHTHTHTRTKHSCPSCRRGEDGGYKKMIIIPNIVTYQRGRYR